MTTRPTFEAFDRQLAWAKEARAHKDLRTAEHFANRVLQHPRATAEQKRQAQLVFDRVAQLRSAEGSSRPDSPPASQPLLRTVDYTYYGNGQTSNITIKDEWTGQGEPPSEYARYHDLALYYASNGKLWLAVNDSWELDEGEPVDYQVDAIREFRYQGAQRYMTRPWVWNPSYTDNAADRAPDPQQAALWTDSVAGLPFGDFEAYLVDGDPVTQEAMRCLAGGGLHAQQTVGGDNPIRYFHGNLGGSTMMLTDEAGGAGVSPAVSYTAFGEPVGDFGSLDTRYLYAGALGFESGFVTLDGANGALGPITVQDQGGQWYEPDIGRMVQALRERGALDTNPHLPIMRLLGLGLSVLADRPFFPRVPIEPPHGIMWVERITDMLIVGVFGTVGGLIGNVCLDVIGAPPWVPDDCEVSGDWLFCTRRVIGICISLVDPPKN